MTWNIQSHSQRENWRRREETQDSEEQTPNSVALCSGLDGCARFIADSTHLSLRLARSTLCVQVSLEDSSLLWHHKHLGVSTEIQASLPQVHTMAYQGLLPSKGFHAGIALTHRAWL